MTKRLWFLCCLGIILMGILGLIWKKSQNLDVKIQSRINERVELGYNRSIVVAHLTEKDTHFFHAGKFPCLPENAIFEIGSLTKTFTAHLTLILAEEQLLFLDDPVQKHLPTVHFPTYEGHQMTLRHLLTFTSGLKDPKKENERNPEAKFTIEDLYHYISQMELECKPGTKIIYSNLAYGLLGHILEKVSQKKYIDLLQEKIFIPFGMHQTYLDVPSALFKTMIQGTALGLDAPYWEIPHLPAFAALKSTASDLAIYLRHYLHDSPYSSFLQKLLIPHTELEHLPIAGTLGWTIDKRGGRNIYAGGGKTLGFSCFMGFCPLKKEGIILLTDATDLDTLGHSFLNPLIPSCSTLYKAISLTFEALQKFNGTYSSKEFTIKIIAKEQYLTVHAENEDSYPLYPMSANRFFAKYPFEASSWVIDFEEDIKKHSMRFILKNENGSQEIFDRMEEKE